MLTTFHRQAELTDGRRADPQYWHPDYERIFDSCRRPLRPLGEFITHLAYGPIVTGQEPPALTEGVVLLNQGQLARTGVDPTGARHIPPGCLWDTPRARVKTGDILLARSGVASLARNRISVFLGDYDAVVGSFVDIVRVEEIDPIYALLYLQTEFAWAQIHRIINGIGTPNISFEEIRGLQIAVPSAQEQLLVRQEYLLTVHALHFEAAVARQKCGDKAARVHIETAQRNLRTLIEKVEAAIRSEEGAGLRAGH